MAAQGQATLRAYGRQEACMQRTHELLDDWTRAFWAMTASDA